MLLAQGGVAGGYALYIADGKLHYVHNYLSLQELRRPRRSGHACATSSSPPPRPTSRRAGARAVAASSIVGEELVGNAEFETTVPIIFGIEGLSCGYDFGEAVTDRYTTPFRFTGEIKRVAVNLSGELIRDEESKIAQLMAQQ